MKHRYRRKFIGRLALLVSMMLAGAEPVIAGEPDAEIESALKSYLRATYARNTGAAFLLLSSPDKAVKSLETYRAENGSFSDAELLLSEELAKAIKFGDFSIARNGKKATVSFSVSLPDANAPALVPIVEGFDKTRLSRLDKATLNERRLQLRQMTAAGDMPVIHSPDEQWDLLNEDGQWRVFVNWAEAIEVNFDAIVMNDLGWEFEPLQDSVLAQPGQTVEMAYRVKNIGSVATTGKARHIIGPEAAMEYLDIVACFCFFEQTLAPNEEMEMPLVFRVSYEAPESVSHFTVNYEFYPLDSFPEDQWL